MPQEKPTEETELPELTGPNLKADESEGGPTPRKVIDLSGFPENCGGYGVEDKPRSAPRPRWAT